MNAAEPGPLSPIETLREVMSRLRDPESGCPWDLEQTFASVAPYTIEEAYEVADAIAREDMEDLRSELGDLLFQVVFHARMAEEEGKFDFDDVASAIVSKLRRRHPHVFGSSAERAAGQSAGSWERIKAEERRDAAAGGALAGVARALPALKRAEKLGGRASAVGFDWSDASGVRDKVAEELAELDAAQNSASAAAVEEELGDLLFSVANLARHLSIDPEACLQKANAKFIRRFDGVEQAAKTAGLRLDELTASELERLWEAAKRDRED